MHGAPQSLTAGRRFARFPRRRGEIRHFFLTETRLGW